MVKETKNSALTTAQAFYHQSIVALDKCFDMGKGDCIYLEKDGDISLITEGENTEGYYKTPYGTCCSGTY